MPITFEALKLRPEIVKACKKQGFSEATPIQELVVPVVAKGRDAIVEAKTGSGKTLAYGLPLLDREPNQTQFPEVLIIAPTRELAQQIEAELVRTAGALARPVVSLTGGGGMDRQKALLDEGAVFVVGTVGRIEELLERKMLRLDHVRTVVLDEVDELLRGGFAPNIKSLFSHVSHDRQTLLFSASIPTEVESFGKQFTRDPARLRTSAARELVAELKHQVLFTTVSGRIQDLGKFLKSERPFQALIFCGTKHETEEVREAISEAGLEAEFLHGDLSPNKRKQLLAKFRSGDLPVLIASDLAARGLDLPGVDLVVNYSLPQGTAQYQHRSGRTGRAGRAGIVLSLVIGQQHERFEKLKATFEFESVEVLANGGVVRHQMMSREDRDLLHRKLPRPDSSRYDERPRPAPEPQGREEPRKWRDESAPREERKPARGGARRDDRKPPRSAGAGKPSRGDAPKSGGRKPARGDAPKSGGRKPARGDAPRSGGRGSAAALRGAAPGRKPPRGDNRAPAGRPPRRGR
jgi:ATP-dependent RNA helicase DeaD